MSNGVVTRKGMYCGYEKVSTTLKFYPVPLKPYRHTVECVGCGTSFETDVMPQEFLSFEEMRRNAA